MRQSSKVRAFLLCALLTTCAAALAATAAASADAVWQDYQKHPPVSTEPHKPVTNQGEVKISVTDATGQTGTAKPLPAPSPKEKLVLPPPAPRVYMRTPQSSDFSSTTSAAGGYTLLLPRIFGSDPTEGLPGLSDAMLLRTAGDNLLCAAVMLNPQDSTAFNAMQSLPAYPEKRLLWRWQHSGALLWNCSVSRHDDYYGDKIILEAQAVQNGKIYEQLYVFPHDRLNQILPQALQAMSSFELNK